MHSGAFPGTGEDVTAKGHLCSPGLGKGGGWERRGDFLKVMGVESGKISASICIYEIVLKK